MWNFISTAFAILSLPVLYVLQAFWAVVSYVFLLFWLATMYAFKWPFFGPIFLAPFLAWALKWSASDVMIYLAIVPALSWGFSRWEASVKTERA